MSTLQGIEDHLAIRALTARYNRAADDHDLDAYAECFTPDGWRFRERRVVPDNDVGAMLIELHPPL